jgi:Family of unknown function (DUF6580)
MMSSRVMLVVSIIISAALSRLLPHVPNVTPITAVALFSGAYLADRRLAFLVPLAAMFVSDLILGFYGPGEMASVYLSFALVVALGLWVGQKRSALRIGSAAITASLLFFAITNFAVWAFGTLYPKSGAGLMECYIAALPFFRHTLAGDLSYTLLVFGGFALLERNVPVLRERAAALR